MPHATNPAAALEAAFRRIQRERMEGVALLNPGLRVEAIGFGRWQGNWLGILVTPWFMNVVLAPGIGGAWVPAQEGEPVLYTFACGTLPFLEACEPETGPYRSCSLASPMGAYVTQESVRAVARAALDMLQRSPASAVSPQPPEEGAPMGKREFLHRLLHP